MKPDDAGRCGGLTSEELAMNLRDGVATSGTGCDVVLVRGLSLLFCECGPSAQGPVEAEPQGGCPLD